MTCRMFMLVYVAEPSIEDMTRASVYRALHNTSALLTVAFNGGPTFPLEADERLTVTCWEERLGLGAAYNQLVNAASEPFICLLHNDCFITDGTLDALVARAQLDGLAFPRVRHDVEDCRARGIRETSALLPPSCCYVVTREAWKAIGGFDESFTGCHFEDMDLFMRAYAHGYKTPVVDEYEVFHRRGVTRGMTGTESNEAFVRNREKYVAKWGKEGSAPLPVINQEVTYNGRSSTFTAPVG